MTLEIREDQPIPYKITDSKGTDVPKLNLKQKIAIAEALTRSIPDIKSIEAQKIHVTKLSEDKFQVHIENRTTLLVTKKTKKYDKLSLFYVDTTTKKKSQLSPEQQNIVRAALERAQVDLSKIKKLHIKKLSDDQFQVKVNNKISILVTKKKGQEGSSEWISLKEVICERSFLESWENFWRSVGLFFYPKAFATPEDKLRPPLEAVREDFHSLVKSLEVAHSWIPEGHEASKSSHDLLERATLINRALRASQPKKRLKKISRDLAPRICSDLTNENTNSLVPVGYLTSDGILQPVLLRFSHGPTGYFLEIFNDTPEMGAKAHLIEKRKFEQTPTPENITIILNSFFEGLVPFDIKIKGRGVEPSTTFQVLMEAGVRKELEKKKIKIKEKKPLERADSLPIIRDNYASLLQSVDAKLTNVWVEISTEEVRTPAHSVPQRISKWFKYIAPKTLSSEERQGLLFSMTIEWANKELQKITKSTSDIKKKEIFETVLNHITHTREKIAVSFTGEIHRSVQLQELEVIEKTCRQGLGALGDKGISSKFFREDPDVEELPMDLPIPRPVEEVPVAVVSTLYPVEVGSIEADWVQSRDELTALVSPESEKKYQRQLARDTAEGLLKSVDTIKPKLEKKCKKLETELEELKKKLTPEIKGQERRNLEKNIKRITSALELGNKALQDLEEGIPRLQGKTIDQIFSSPEEAKLFVHMFAEILVFSGQMERFSGRFLYHRDEVSYTTMVDLFEKMILFPHLYPSILPKEGKSFSEDQDRFPNFIGFLRRMSDPNITVYFQERETVALIKKIMSLRHVIPLECQQRLEEQELESIANKEVHKDFAGSVQRAAQQAKEDVSSMRQVEEAVVSKEVILPEEVSVSGLPSTIVLKFNKMTNACTQLMDIARAEENIQKRRELLQEVQDRSLEILRKIPPPGTEGAFGEESIWAHLSKEEIEKASASITLLQQFIFESQLKLGQSKLSGVARFLLIKAQVIGVALIRRRIVLEQEKIEDFVRKLPESLNDEQKKEFDEIFERDEGSEELYLTEKAIYTHFRSIKDFLSNHVDKEQWKDLDFGLLTLEEAALDTEKINAFLTQDLTAQLSADASLEKDLTSVYHFIVRDFNRGSIDGFSCDSLAFSVKGRSDERGLDFRRQRFDQTIEEPIIDQKAITQLEDFREQIFMCKACCDPDFTLFGEEPEMGIPWLPTNYEFLLKQGKLQLELKKDEHNNSMTTQVKVGEQVVCTIYPEGHPDFSYNPEQAKSYTGEDKKRIQEKTPFLPAVDLKEKEDPVLYDMRVRASEERWLQYAVEQALSPQEEGALPLDTRLLQKLLLLRKTAENSSLLGDKFDCTAYSACTAVNALKFLSDVDNIVFLSDSNVQKFIEESIFGPFLLQQAIPRFHEEISVYCESIARRIEQAIENKRPEVACFLQHVLLKLLSQVRYVEESLVQQGLSSGVIDTPPLYTGKSSGIFYSSKNTLKDFSQEREGLEEEQVFQPLLYEIKKIHTCVSSIEAILNQIPTDELISAFSLEKITDLEEKRAAYIAILALYKTQGIKKEEIEKIKLVLEGYQLLCGMEGRLEEEKILELSLWVRQTIMPLLQDIEASKRDSILTNLVNTTLKTPLKEGVHWEFTPPLTYQCGFSKEENDFIEFFPASMTVVDHRQLTVLTKSVYIPDEILKKKEVQKALKNTRIRALEKRTGEDVSYSWKTDGQEFSLKVHGSKVELKRTIGKETYVYVPIVKEDVTSQAEALVVDNGIWMLEGEGKNKGYIFPKGEKIHTPEERYIVAIVDSKITDVKIDEAKEKIHEAKSVSNQKTLDTASPVSFASTENTLLIRNEKMEIVEIQFKNSQIHFLRNSDTQEWEYYYAGEKIGTVDKNPDVDEMRRLFGQHFEQYVVPLKEKGFVKYLMLPYPKKLLPDGRVEILQDGSMPFPQVVEVKEGVISWPIIAGVYVANRLIQEASLIKDQAIVREKYLQANAILRSLQSERPSSTIEELETMAAIFRAIEKNLVIDERKVPSPYTVAMNLKLLLTIRRLQNMQREALSGSVQEQFSVSEKMMTLYEKYLVMEKEKREGVEVFSAFSERKKYLAALLLNDEEKAALSHVGDQLLHEITSEQGMVAYFGLRAQDRPVEMAFFDHVDSIFPLSLLRHAKKVDPSFQISDFTRPKTVVDLLENFWNYVNYISENNCPPQKLAFLFKPSIFPATQSGEEETSFRIVDEQVRQFLLSFAAMKQKRKSLPEEIRRDSDQFKQAITKFDTEKLQGYFSLLRPTLSGLLETFVGAVHTIDFTVENAREEKGVEECSKEYKKLQFQLSQATVALSRFSGELKKFTDDVLKILTPIKEKKVEYETKIRQIEEEIWEYKDEVASKLSEISDEVEQEIFRQEAVKKQADLDQKLEAAKEQLEIFYDEEAFDLNGAQTTNKSCLTEYTEILSELNLLQKNCDSFLTQMQQGIEGVSKVISFLREVKKFDENIKKASTSAQPYPELHFPEEEKARQSLQNLMGAERKEISLKEKLQLFREVGFKNAMPIFMAALKFDKDQLEAIGNVLGMIAFLPQVMPELPRLTLGENPAQTDLFANIEFNALAQKYLSKDQLDLLKTHLSSASSQERNAVLATLSKALNMHETRVAALTQFWANFDAIQRFFEELQRRSKASLPKDVTEAIRIPVFKDSFSTDYQEFFIDPQETLEEHTKRHEEVVQSLVDGVLPESDSLYKEDLSTSVEGVRTKDPLPYATLVDKDKLDEVEQIVKKQAQRLFLESSALKKEILDLIKKQSISSLSKSIQEILLRKGSDSELLVEICKQHRNGAFESILEIDKKISQFEINQTRYNALMLIGEKPSAISALGELKKLREQSKDETLTIQKREAIATQYAFQSSILRDCLDRCQNTSLLEEILSNDEFSALRPHVRKIIYFQYALGMTLRRNQIEALADMVKSPDLLKQLRMGLGKTDVLLPIILDILSSDGKIAIGIVPAALFKKNFEDMDSKTRVAFELAGNQFIFTRQSFPKPYSSMALHALSQQCRGFLEAFARKEYVLTTLESKASIDNKIMEIECSLHSVQRELSQTSKEDKVERARIYEEIENHQKALGCLYRVKSVFELPEARLVIDEIDDVASSRNSVNSELGEKQPLAPILCDTASQIFDVIRTSKSLEGLRERIQLQFDLSAEKVNEYIKIIAVECLIPFNDMPEEIKASPENREKFLNWFLGKEEWPFETCSCEGCAQYFDENLRVIITSPENREKFVNWFAGAEWPFEADLLNKLGQKVAVLREALHSSLRACLGLKLGLNADFDKVREAVGIPSSHGIRSDTQKYEDPLMQLCLTMMTALYKPQGNEFIVSQASSVYEGLDGGKEASSLEKRAKELLKGWLDAYKLDKKFSFHDALKPNPEVGGIDEAAKMLLRQRFALCVVSQKYIYLSSWQISRPTQDAIRGTNILGFTGTATRNQANIISEEGMRSVGEEGRETTAEVLYRLAKSSSEGIQTRVSTYSLDSKLSLEEFKACVKDPRYRFIVNQAGACDMYTQPEIIHALAESGRPIIYVDIDSREHFVLINNERKLLKDITEEEKEKVRSKGFYYFHTPDSRGTNFNPQIPTGSTGVLLLAPKVNANDRDQALYRARQLGSGHTVECRISEKQAEEIRVKTGKKIVTLKDILQIEHEQTYQDESKEDLSAYRLHIQGILRNVAEKMEKELYLSVEQKTEEKDDFIDIQDSIYECVRSFFVQASDNKTYLSKLMMKALEGGEEDTKKNLLRLIKSQIRVSEGLLQRLNDMKKRFEEKGNFLATTYLDKMIPLMNEAHKKLNEEQKKIEDEWESFSRIFPSKTLKVADSTGVAEIESEQEVQVAAASSERQVQKIPFTLLGVNKDVLDSLSIEPIHREKRMGVVGDHNMKIVCPGIMITPSLEYQYQQQGRGMIGNLRIMTFYYPKDDKIQIAFVDSGDVEYFKLQKDRALFNGTSFLCVATIFEPIFKQDGSFELKRTGVLDCVQGSELTDDIQEKALLGLLLLGVSPASLSIGQWGFLEKYWDSLSKNKNEEEMKVLKKAFAERFEKTNPRFFQEIGSHLWEATDPGILLNLMSRKEGSLSFREEQWRVIEAYWTSLSPEKKNECKKLFNSIEKTDPVRFHTIANHLWAIDEEVERIQTILAPLIDGDFSLSIEAELQKIANRMVRDKVRARMQALFSSKFLEK